MTERSEDADLPFERSIGKHDVFISHRGIEMKRRFANHLYHYLELRGIKAFLDMKGLPKGDDARPYMLEAARRAIIQVPIFNSKYAESKWCLDELVEMIKSTKSSNSAKIFPIFYDVKSEDLRSKVGPFAEAIEAHRKKGERDEDTIKGWEDALIDASWRDGYRLEAYNQCEGDLLIDLVEKIVKEIQDRTLAEPDPNAVGLERKVREVVERFHLKENKNVFFLLLWGMGGIGKTTLARAIFDRLRKEFRATSFVEKPSGEKPNQKIQHSLLNDLLLHKNVEGDLRRGKGILKHGVSGKVLIVLDDVEEVESIEEVIDLTSLQRGSLILVTSRSQSVFPLGTSDVLEGARYEVLGMVSDESLQLLCLHAFKKHYPAPGFEELAERVSQACSGLPLSLEVLGRHLSKSKKKEAWKDAIAKLRNNQYEGIRSKLMISYEALNEEEQEMFLDVACLLIGEEKRSAECFWGDGLFEAPSTALENLVDRCLVKVVKREKSSGICVGYQLTMHDHLRDLGRFLVKKSGKWSRVWDDTDLLRVLQSKQGLDQIRGISTSLPELSVGLLSQMRSLRLLFLNNTELDSNDEGLEGLEIRWLKLIYDDVAPKELFGMNSLTVLTLREGAETMKNR